MSEKAKYEAQKKKMDGLCEENNLSYRFRKEEFPITFTIRPLQSAALQLSMLENAEEEGYTSPDASMMWIFEDGILTTKVQGGTFTISKTLRTKIENILLRMIAFWQQYFFRCVLETNALAPGKMPTIGDEGQTDAGGDECESEDRDSDGEVQGYEPNDGQDEDESDDGEEIPEDDAQDLDEAYDPFLYADSDIYDAVAV